MRHCQRHMSLSQHKPTVATSVQQHLPRCSSPPTSSQLRIQQQQEQHSRILDLTAINRRQTLLASAVLLQQLGLLNHHLAAAAAAAAAAVDQHEQMVTRSCFTLADIQTNYDRYAGSYDRLDGGSASEALGFPELRQQLIAQASGNVLEVAVGTGLNLPLYTWSNITSLTGIDLSQGMLTEAARRVSSNSGLASYTPTAAATALHTAASDSMQSSDSIAVQVLDTLPHLSDASSGSALYPVADNSYLANGNKTQLPVQLLQADVTSLPFPDDSFDVVLDTFSLCVFSNPAAALSEMTRVLKPGGKLLLLEHTQSDNPLLGSYQGMTRSLVAPLSKGCDWGQDVPGLISQLSSLYISSQQRHLAGTLVSITATKQP